MKTSPLHFLHRATLRVLRPLALALFTTLATAAPTDEVYKLGPDSEPQAGVPQGKVSAWAQLPSEAYPGTLHDYCVYVPAQYDPAKPAALMIFQDGQAWVRATGDYRAPFVLDNLIYRREIPVMIAVFINPGRKPEQAEASASDWGDRSNRPQEYNALDDKYAKVIIDELLPVLAKQYNLSPQPEDRGIGGASSGAIAAFTVAWHRPDQFRKVLSTIGSFTNIRGGHVYPDLIRNNERKPIRIFLQDGVNDNRGLRGQGEAATYSPDRDWHAQNIKMVAGADGEGLRRELHLGHRHAFQQAGGARFCPRCCAGSGATTRARMMRATRATGRFWCRRRRRRQLPRPEWRPARRWLLNTSRAFSRAGRSAMWSSISMARCRWSAVGGRRSW